MWSDPRVDKLLYFLMLSVNLALKSSSHLDWDHKGIMLSKWKLICQSWAKLKVW